MESTDFTQLEYEKKRADRNVFFALLNTLKKMLRVDFSYLISPFKLILLRIFNKTLVLYYIFAQFLLF